MTQSKKYPTVTISTPANCYGAVGASEGLRILSEHAPLLPMPNRTMPKECRCRYKKYVDRREDEQGYHFKYGA